jgi:hypothetical protein
MSTTTCPANAASKIESGNRRRSERHPCVIEAWLNPTGNASADAGFEVTSIDLSRHGIGLHVPKALVVGDYFIVEIGLGNQQLKSEIRIVACRPLDERPGYFQVGAEFC